MPEPLNKDSLNPRSGQIIRIETDFETFIRQHRLLFDGQFSGIAFLNREYEILYGNQYLVDLLKLDMGNVGRKKEKTPLPFQLETITPAINKCIRTMERVVVSSKLNLSHKSTLNQFLISIQPVLEASNDKICGALVSINIDNNATTGKKDKTLHHRIKQLETEEQNLISRVKALSQENNSNHSLLKDLMENSPFGIFMIGPEKGIIQTNRAAEKMLGLNRHKIIGHSCSSILECNENCPLLKANPHLDRVETIGICKNGEKKTLLRSSTSLKETGHNFVLESFIDISEIKEAQIAIESANKTKDEFIAKMSHELRTPLNAVIGFSDILLNFDGEIPNEELIDDIQHIQNAGTHLLRMVDELLDISKISAGKIKLEPEDLEIKSFINEIIDTMSPTAHGNNNKIEIQYKNDPGDMHTDPVRFRQVIDNLLINACKFTKDGKISVHVERLSIQKTEWIQLSVSDTGIGITADNLGKIFNAFEQADNSIKREYGGTGLGLAITKKICMLLNGEIDVESSPSQGSTFTVRIPCYPVLNNN